MIAALTRPMPAPQLALATVALGVAVAVYCVAYTALAGRPETLGESLVWAVVNVCPWLLAVEGAKRAARWSGALLAIGAAFVLSMGLGILFGEVGQSHGFEAWRRVPVLLLVAAGVAGLRWLASRHETRFGECDPLPLLPRQIDWVRAAGNYVELRTGERTVVHRASLGAAERELALHGFVRIHRSTLVRRDRIARVRPYDVVLHDGTHLKLGKRFRTSLDS